MSEILMSRPSFGVFKYSITLCAIVLMLTTVSCGSEEMNATSCADDPEVCMVHYYDRVVEECVPKALNEVYAKGFEWKDDAQSQCLLISAQSVLARRLLLARDTQPELVLNTSDMSEPASIYCVTDNALTDTCTADMTFRIMTSSLEEWHSKISKDFDRQGNRPVHSGFRYGQKAPRSVLKR